MTLILRHSELDSESKITITQIDAESTFVASTCECGVAVRHDRVRKVLAIQPTPDWKGGAAVAVRQWSRKAEPWKAGNCMDLTGHGVPGTVKQDLPSRKKEKLKLEL